MAAADVLTVHYRRAAGDHAGWELWLWAPDAPGWAPRAATRPARSPDDAWGAVFRLPRAGLAAGALGLLPRTPAWADKDDPERVAAAAAAAAPHVFVLQGAPGVRLSPLDFLRAARPRFAALLTPARRAVRDGNRAAGRDRPWVVVRTHVSGRPYELFPRAVNGAARGLVFLPNDAPLSLTLVSSVPEAARELRVSETGQLAISFSPTRSGVVSVVDLDTPQLLEEVSADSEVQEILAEQSAGVPVLDISLSCPDRNARMGLASEDHTGGVVADSEGTNRSLQSVGESRVVGAPEEAPKELVVLVLTLSGVAPPDFVLTAGPLVGLNHALPTSRSLSPAERVAYSNELPSGCSRVGAAIVVDLDGYSDAELYEGLAFVYGSAMNGVLSQPGMVSWKPSSHGFVTLFLLERNELISATEANLALHYHRYDAFHDFANWELHLAANGIDLAEYRNTAVESSGCSTDSGLVGENGVEGSEISVHTSAVNESMSTNGVLKLVALPSFPKHFSVPVAEQEPSSTERPGQTASELTCSRCEEVVFDLSVMLLLPINTELSLQCVKKCIRSGSADELSIDTEVAKQEEDAVVVMQDVVRKLSVSSFTVANGHVTPASWHAVQGQQELSLEPPEREALNSQRYVEIFYRRYGDGDHVGWELWCWDESDVLQTNHASQPVNSEVSKTKPGIKFFVDRAKFGCGSTVKVLPRYGGSSWLRKDEPARILPTPDQCMGSDGKAVSFFISQGLSQVLSSVEDARSMLHAHVESEYSFSIVSPVPFHWIVRGSNRSSAAELLPRLSLKDTSTVSLHEKEAHESRELDVDLVEVCRSNPVTLMCTISRESPMHFVEDYLVECSTVTLREFNPCTLQWKEQADWDNYLYPGSLGWDYTPEKCVFRCFAPLARTVFVVLYETATGGVGERIPMRRIPEGCWKAVIDGDIKGKYYKLLALGDDKRQFPGVEVIDPYSRCNTAHWGRGLIYGSETTPVAPRPSIKPEHAIVYELHIRDATIDPRSGVKCRGKFLGLAEQGTKLQIPREKDAPTLEDEVDESSHVSTALQHIIDMGVNTVQIMPIQDFDNDESDDESYGWGYMPVHFFSPDGWYATETSSAARVTECKLLIDALHKAGLKVILDVVYNHTAEDGNELNLDARFSFNGLAPRYFYRNCLNTPKAHNGESTCGRRDIRSGASCGTCVSNGSGCGNEFRSESPMGRKFIVDSLKYWVNEFCVDGFRFDLLGLIDVETLSTAAHELHSIDPNIMLYGEPWCGGLTPILSTEKGMQRSKGFGVFNNSFRDALRGSPFGIEETFVMDGGRVDEVKRGIIGSIDEFTDSPLETINYVECHDNYTLWDHMKFYIGLRTDDIKFSEADLTRIHKLAAAILFVSQGVPLIQMGQEMCRTKYGDENSYQSSDEINMIRWDSKLENWDVVSYYQGLIQLRKSHPELFCKTNATEIRSTITFFEDLQLPVQPQCIGFRILAGCDDRDVEGWREVVVLLNAQPTEVSFDLPEEDSLQHWVQVVSDERAGVDALAQPLYGSVSVAGRSAAVYRRATTDEQTNALVRMRLQAVSDVYETPFDASVSPYVFGVALAPSTEQERINRMIKERDMFLFGRRS